jgi:phosphocarrier protein HPr
MVSQKVKITNPTGLHLRPAGIFSNIANKFECRITFEYENSIANAKSVLSILGAGIKSGDEILLICEGEEEEKALKAIHKDLTLHDFRVVSGDTHMNVIFDVVVPYHLKLENNEILQELKKQVDQKYDACYLVVTFDKDYAG